MFIIKHNPKTDVVEFCDEKGHRLQVYNRAKVKVGHFKNNTDLISIVSVTNNKDVLANASLTTTIILSI